MNSKYKIKFLSNEDRIIFTDTNSKKFKITCGNDEQLHSAEDINAVIIKTMDTGPSVEDMYAELHISGTIYIILSETPTFKELILDIVNSIVSLDLKLFIEASTYHFNKTFVLYKRDGYIAEIEDSEEKKTAVLEASIFALNENENLSGFIFAMMSFCNMYLLYGTGEHKDMLVNLSAISENLVPIYTSFERCPVGEQFEKRKLSPNMYIRLLSNGNNDAMVNFNSEFQVMISSKQIQNILLPLILLREETVDQQNLSIKTNKENKSFLKKLFGRK